MISSHAPVKIRLITVSQSQAGASADQQQKAQDSDQEDRHEGDLQDRKDRSSNPTTADKQTSPECYTWRRQDRIDKGIEPGSISLMVFPASPVSRSRRPDIGRRR
jgi:hypothetical protein